MKMTKRILAMVLVLSMALSLVACGAKTPVAADESKKQASVVTDKQQTAKTEDLTREEKELIVELMGNGEKAENLSENELDTLVDQIINKDDNQSSADFAENKDAYNEYGEMTKPFDQVYPELIEQEQVKFSGESILIKLKKDTLTDGLKAAGIGALEQIVPLEGAAWYEAKLTEGTDAQKALEAVRELKEVLLAEYNYEIQTALVSEGAGAADPKGEDPKIKEQWHLKECGIKNAAELQKYGGGASSTIVAVIDTGVDYDHEDLADNIWVNTKEIPNNNIDDDKNGYVDDYYGVDIVAGKGNGDDTNGHGTHVAGIIAAQNNKLGVVGIAYNVKIMSVKAASHSGYLLQGDIAKAVLYAYENGAEVINMSFGGTACSIAVQDALATAYTRCVLVASAGNSGAPNQGNFAIPNYPAALTYVLGVMSVDKSGKESAFTNWDVIAYNGVEYELYAPGEEIVSTLPNNKYGSLSGTSMAAPMVSAMATILRSEFEDRDMYPTKFIYGQLAATSEHDAKCFDPEEHGLHNLPMIVNLEKALTKLPKPDINVQEYYIFDDPKYSSKNNGDGVIDAGETIALGLVLRNRWGMSENTMVSIDTLSQVGIEDPYFTILNPTVNYGSVGTYSTQDCGKIYTDELFTGWENPFLIQVAEDCPNDYIFTLNVVIRCENALDEKDKTLYVFGDDILDPPTLNPADPITVMEFVRSGYILPSIIEEDMVLTPDNLYIIPNATVIKAGVTVKVMPGTHIQFWSDDADDPYANTYIAYLLVNGKFLVEGTKENPVYIYPSDLMNHYGVEIGSSSTGYVSLKYADITNFAYYGYSLGNHTGTGNHIDLADHCTFRNNYSGSLAYRYLEGGVVKSTNTSSVVIGNINAVDCVFYKIAFGTFADLNGTADRCIFVQCGIDFKGTYENCVFLGNSMVNRTNSTTYYNSSYNVSNSSASASVNAVYYCEETGTTYVTGNINPILLEACGGKDAIIETEAEFNWLKAKLLNSTTYGMGITYNGEKYVWSDGSEIGSFMVTDELVRTWEKGKTLRLKSGELSLSESQTYGLYEFSGPILPTEIIFKEYEINIDLEATYQINPLNKPVQLPLDSFVYESSDESILSVSDTGLVTPLKKGNADVYVYSEDRAVWNYITFQVIDYVALESAAFPVASLKLAYGETASAGCVLAPADTTRNNVVYISSNESVAVVDAAGNVTGVGFGSAMITATIEDFVLTLPVEVVVPTISFNSNEMWIEVGKSKKVPVIVEPANTAPSAISYQSSDESILTISDDGRMTGLASGQVTITAQCGPLVVESTVNVVSFTQSLTFTQSTVGTVLTDQVVALPEVNITDGSSVNLHWQSTDEEVAEVIDGQLHLKKAGTTTIIVKDQYSGYSASTILFVHSEKMPQIVKLDGSYVQLADGRLYSWDSTGATLKYENVTSWSAYGQLFAALSDGTLIIGSETRNDLQGKNIVNAVASYHSQYSTTAYFAVTEDGEVFAMGGNSYGQLGIGSTSNSSTFQKVALDAKIVQAACTGRMSYFLAENGDLYVAGGTSLQAKTPVLMGRNVSNLSAENLYGAVYTSSDKVIYLNETSSAPYTVTTIKAYDWIHFDNAYSTSNTSYKYIWGVGLKDGVAYRIYIYFNPTTGTVSTHKEAKISGIANAIVGYCYNSNNKSDSDYIYVATDDGLIHKVYQGTVYHYTMETFLDNDLKLTGTNITDGIVYDPEFLQLSFNKSLTSCASSRITLYEDGIPCSTSFSINDNKLTLVPNSVNETTYRIVFEPGALSGTSGSKNSQTIELSFSLKYEDEEVIPGESPEETPEETPEEEQVVIHESVLDTTIQRKLTVSSLKAELARIKEEKQINTAFYGNVVLNPISTDTNVNHWLRPLAPSVSAGTYSEIPLGGNYWGSTNQRAIELQMTDYTDFITYARLMYAPYLTEAPENTFPFVTSVKLFNKYGEEVTTVGNEEVTFQVKFNRDMDTSIPLLVRFGSAYPYGDYEIEGRYVDARTWEGVYTLNTLIENGYQYFTISNGCSATDDLELQLDQYRFFFEIDTTAAQALIMQGNAMDTGIELKWTQDDFDTLMGYNVYRSTKEDGLYTRVNTTTIPADMMTFFDDTVEPGVVYYYNFTVVKTDLTESEPSGKIVIMSKDTMAPDIYHSPVSGAFTGSNLVVSATVTDNLNIAYANLYYRVAGTEEWSIIRMNKLNDKYSAIIPASAVTLEGIEYYIEAFDGVSFTYKGTAEVPYAIAVQEAVDTNALGDVDGDGIITNLDALLLLYAINDKYNLTAEEFARADLNGDGELWAAEALRILQYVSGVVGSVKL